MLEWLLLLLLLLLFLLCLRDERDGFEEEGSGMNGTVKPVFAVLITLLGGTVVRKWKGWWAKGKKTTKEKVLSKIKKEQKEGERRGAVLRWGRNGYFAWWLFLCWD